MADEDIERDGMRNHVEIDPSSIDSLQEPSEETSLLSSNTKKDDYQTDVSTGDSSLTDNDKEFRSPVGVIALLLVGIWNTSNSYGVTDTNVRQVFW